MLTDNTPSSDHNVAQGNPAMTDSVREYFRELGRLKGGFSRMSHATRVHLGRVWSAKGWAVRRVRYGPTGRRPQAYAKWLADHGKPLPGELEAREGADKQSPETP